MLNLKRMLTKLANAFYAFSHFKSGSISGTSMQIYSPTGMEIRSNDSAMRYWITDSLLICDIQITINANNTSGNVTIRMPYPDDFPTLSYQNNGAIRVYRRRSDYPELLSGDAVNFVASSSNRYIELYERNFISNHTACQYIQIVGFFVIPYKNMI